MIDDAQGNCVSLFHYKNSVEKNATCQNFQPIYQIGGVAMSLTDACQALGNSAIILATQPPRLLTMRNLGGFFSPLLKQKDRNVA